MLKRLGWIRGARSRSRVPDQTEEGNLDIVHGPGLSGGKSSSAKVVRGKKRNYQVNERTARGAVVGGASEPPADPGSIPELNSRVPHPGALFMNSGVRSCEFDQILQHVFLRRRKKKPPLPVASMPITSRVAICIASPKSLVAAYICLSAATASLQAFVRMLDPNPSIVSIAPIPLKSLRPPSYPPLHIHRFW